MYYKLIRTKAEGKAVAGKLYRTSHYINKRTGLLVERLHYICDTLENADYLIPAGSYPVERTWSPKFKKLLPEILEVPEREGIRIHMGTIPEHSTGCVLTNFAAMANLQVLFNRIDQINELNKDDYGTESATITIVDASPA